MRKRKDCFFGLHFDYHAAANTTVGSAFDEELVGRLLDEVKPDFVQCDTKGFPGYASYATKVGKSCTIVRDTLRIWRKLTAERGIPLYAHFGALPNRAAIAEHPEWAAVGTDGKPSPGTVSVFSDYDDKVLIPMLTELAVDYGLDGAWVDGETPNFHIDRSEGAKRAFKAETGLDPDDRANSAAYNDFLREAFRRHVAYYVKKVHEVAPGFEICDNWSFSALYMPDDPKGSGVDFLSGDSLENMRANARMLSAQGMTWDMMSWGIAFPSHCEKGAAQLCREAAAVISHGGAFQVYTFQELDTGIREKHMIGTLAELSRFCNARRPYCKDARQINDVLTVLSQRAHYAACNDTDRPFDSAGYYKDYNGLINAFCDCGVASDSTISKFITDEKLRSYGTVALSDCRDIEPQLKKALLCYAENGGHLLLTGHNTAKLFARELGYTAKRSFEDDFSYMLVFRDTAARLRPHCTAIESDRAADASMTRLGKPDTGFMAGFPPRPVEEDVTFPAMLRLPFGRGTVTSIPFDLGTAYTDCCCFQLKKLISEALSVRERKVTASSNFVELNLTEKDGRDYIHVITLLGEHNSEYVKSFDEIPPQFDITLNYRTSRRVKSVTLLPENKPLAFSQKDGTVSVTLPRLDIYSIVRIEYPN